MQTESSVVSWSFPLPRCHAGVPISNGVQGLMVWGGGATLCLTIGRLGFWDRRGGNRFVSKVNYPQVKALLQANDEQGLRDLFGHNLDITCNARPHQLGGGRLELVFADDWQLDSADLDLRSARLSVHLVRDEQRASVEIAMAALEETGWLELSPELRLSSSRLRPAWEWIGDDLEKVDCRAPSVWDGGMEQTLPEDDPLAICWQQEGNILRWASSVAEDARFRASETLTLPLSELRKSTDAWWEAYWEDVPSVFLPDGRAQELVNFGLYMQACCTPPQGLACTLQGALMEEIIVPPWSNDYHLNINLQMIYTPALITNRLSHFTPLWDLMKSWLPELRVSGQAFFGREDALMLPHAVDDRCQVVGSFWTGSIDHACTAWMAMICWDCCRYGGDETLLRDLAWPLLKGAFAGFAAMVEEDEGGGLCLPVSVSPEYKGARMDAWGKNASFQLAAAHAVLGALPQAAEWLGETLDPDWADMQERLPTHSSAERYVGDENPDVFRERILLWDGQDLDGSHRHHSHLAGLVPFKVLDPKDEVLANSVRWWRYRGFGAWSGWSMPWAASILAHLGHGDGALQYLRIWEDIFTNGNRGSLHDANFPGTSVLDSGSAYWGNTAEVMQLDARFGSLSAVFDLLVQEWKGVIRVFPAIPRDWQDVSVDGVLLPGGFLLSAGMVGGEVTDLAVRATRPGTIRLQLPDSEVVTRTLAEGEVWDVLCATGASV